VVATRWCRTDDVPATNVVAAAECVQRNAR
jgi:hypothetical protein